MGELNWVGWKLSGIGDFAGDGKDDLVLYYEQTGSLVLCSDGSVDAWQSIGQIDAEDWSVAGCGDYNGDGSDDLLVRQSSTGEFGYFASGDLDRWFDLGEVDPDWTVIA